MTHLLLNRSLLFRDLNDFGISTTFFNTIKTIYSQAIKLNGSMTEWFNVSSGLKQGCVLSPVLFNIYINSLVTDIKALDIGIDIECEQICILLCADDIILIAENENDLQLLLDILNTWCKHKALDVNFEKTKIVHFRNPSVPPTNEIFLLGEKQLGVVSKYQYLGLLLTEFLDYNAMAKAVARSAGQALSLLILKSKVHGRFHFDTCTKLYDSLVWSVISYGAAIWGTQDCSCINAVQHRAIRFFMSPGKYSPNEAINGDMGWKPPCVKQWSCVFRHWARCNVMSTDRVNYKVFRWAFRNAFNKKKNWCFRIMTKFRECNLELYTDLENILPKNVITQLEDFLFDKYKVKWQNRMFSQKVGNK
jgi:hypothetical protein